MGAHSTIRITRTTAKNALVEALERIVAKGQDDFLEKVFDEALDESLYNVRIVNDGEANDDEKVGWIAAHR